ncbi:hypothetical protein [Shewanella sp.]|uniref:hypothetical protein n=1 Tax=Shewanella sp. TaxID=50422 RepID=UPI0040479B6E
MIGDKLKVGFNVGEIVDDCIELKKIEIWIAGQLVTFRDNIAHISSLAHSAQNDAERTRNLQRFNHYFIEKNETEIHQFIMGTRLSDIEFQDSDEMFYEHQIFDWGPNTDDVICFLVEFNGQLYITAEFFRENESVIYTVKIDENTLNSALLSFSQALCQS